MMTSPFRSAAQKRMGRFRTCCERAERGWPKKKSSSRGPKAHELHATAVEGLDIGGRGKPEQPGDFHRGGVLWVDQGVDAHIVLEGAGVHRIFDVADPRDGETGAQALGGEAADHVDLVHAGGGDEKIGCVGAGLPECGDGSAVSFDAHDVQGFVGFAQGLLAGVHNGDIVLLTGEMLSQCVADFAVADNNNVQGAYILSARPHGAHGGPSLHHPNIDYRTGISKGEIRGFRRKSMKKGTASGGGRAHPADSVPPQPHDTAVVGLLDQDGGQGGEHHPDHTEGPEPHIHAQQRGQGGKADAVSHQLGLQRLRTRDTIR